jgi:hypothetical protein
MLTRNIWRVSKTIWRSTLPPLYPPKRGKPFACAVSFATKILHTDFRAARDKLNDLGEETQSGGVRKIDTPVVSMAAIFEKIAAARTRTEGVLVGDTSSTAEGTIYGWFLEAASGDIFRKACAAFRSAAAIADRLADIENS